MKMFSDCSGPCVTCTCTGGCLAGHGDDHYTQIGAEEALRRLKRRRTEGGVKYTAEDLSKLALIAGVQPPPTIPDEVMVQVKDLKVLAQMGCEHVPYGHKSCDEADIERGGCCNACWAARWARRVLKKREEWKP